MQEVCMYVCVFVFLRVFVWLGLLWHGLILVSDLCSNPLNGGQYLNMFCYDMGNCRMKIISNTQGIGRNC